jgi:hypothetical protein
MAIDAQIRILSVDISPTYLAQYFILVLKYSSLPLKIKLFDYGTCRLDKQCQYSASP